MTEPLDETDSGAEVFETANPEAIPDRRLELMLVCAHPAIDPAVRTPLMLQTVLGVHADAIAHQPQLAGIGEGVLARLVGEAGGAIGGDFLVLLLDLGLGHAMEKLIDFWSGRHPNVVFDLKVIPESFGDLLDEGIYRIAREGLNNALRHGNPSKIGIRILLATNDVVEVEIIDDGGGLQTSIGPVGFGITGMRERTALLGGTISVQNCWDGKGVLVSARFPYQKPAQLDVRSESLVRT